jgi:hypothetical protein
LIYDIREPLTLSGPPAIGGIGIVKLMPELDTGSVGYRQPSPSEEQAK